MTFWVGYVSSYDSCGIAPKVLNINTDLVLQKLYPFSLGYRNLPDLQRNNVQIAYAVKFYRCITSSDNVPLIMFA